MSLELTNNIGNARHCPPTEEQLAKLKELLVEFYKGIEPVLAKSFGQECFEPLEQRFLDELIDDPLNLKEHGFHKTNTDLLSIDFGYPIAYRNEKNKIVAIQLRKCHSNKLLLGCGNNPTSICYHTPVSKDFNKECHSFGKGDEWWSKTIIKQHEDQLARGKNHTHEEYTTIDCNIVMNPTIISFFGWYKLPSVLLQDNSISEICTEGIILTQLRYFTSEYERLTGKNLEYCHDIAFD